MDSSISASSDNSAGSGGLRGSRHRSHSHAQSITPACRWQSGSVGLAAGHHSVHSHATEGGEVSSSKSILSRDKEDVTGEDENTEADKSGVETSSNGQVASDGEEHPHTQDTLTGISQVFGTHEDTDPESKPEEKIQSIWQKWCPKSPKEDSPLESSESSSEEAPPTDEAFCDEAKQKLGCWTHISMLGITERLLKASWAGPTETP